MSRPAWRRSSARSRSPHVRPRPRGMDKILQSTTAAAIHGTALGGGILKSVLIDVRTAPRARTPTCPARVRSPRACTSPPVAHPAAAVVPSAPPAPVVPLSLSLSPGAPIDARAGARSRRRRRRRARGRPQNPAAKVLIDIAPARQRARGRRRHDVRVRRAGEFLRQAAALHREEDATRRRSSTATAWRATPRSRRSRARRSRVPAARTRPSSARSSDQHRQDALSSKVLSQDKEHFFEIAVNAVLKLKGSTNLDQIQIITRGCRSRSSTSTKPRRLPASTRRSASAARSA